MVEITDARIPVSSRNPDIDAICAGKPRLIVLNRADQADPSMTGLWTACFKGEGYSVLETDAKSGRGVNQFSAVVQGALKEQIAKWREKGQVGRPVRAMVVGVPNVGKSTFINKVAKKSQPRRVIGLESPAASSGLMWISPWTFWILRGSYGPNLTTNRPGSIWPLLER